MPLQLNPTREAYREYSKETGYSRNIDQMPAILSDNRNPISIAHLMQKRFDTRNADAQVKTDWMDYYFDTSDLKAQRGNEVKLALTTYADCSITPLGRKYLELINAKEQLINGAVNLGINDRYESLNGDGVLTTTREKLAEVIDSSLTEQQAKNSLFWRFVLRHPDAVPKEFAIPGLHEEVIPYIFSEAKQRFNYDANMGVYPGSCSNDVSEMRAWYVGRLDYGSSAYGRGILGNGDGRLVGIAPEALSAPGMAVPSVKAYSTADAQKFGVAVENLKNFVKPELLEDILALQRKL